MVEEKQKSKSWRDIYRLVLLKEDTLEEVSSYRISFLNLYIAISSVLIITAVLVVAAIFFTPLKKLVPGYGDPLENPAYVSLNRKVLKMEKQIEAYETYTENFKKLLTSGDAGQSEIDQDPSSGLNDENNTPIERQISPDNPTIDNENEERASSVPQFNTSPREINNLYFVPPVKGIISSKFDLEIDHYGIDVVAPQNTPVKAILDGHIISSDWTLETGNTIGIQHDNNLVSFYKHNASLLKKEGAFVRAGEAIAIIGNTGELTTGPHLHFELWSNGQPVDPEDYIDFH